MQQPVRPQQSAAATPLILSAGTQQELLIDKGIDRMAIGDETVAGVTITRKTPNSPAARLIVTGKAAGRTSLMVWEKGNAAATTYADRSAAPLFHGRRAMDSMTAHQQARDTALASAGEKTDLIDRSVVNVRSGTVQVEVKIVEFNRSVLKQAGLNIFSTRPNSNGFSFGVFSPSSLGSVTFAPNGQLTGQYNNPLAQAFSLLFNFSKAGIGLDVGFLEGNGMARVLAEPTLVAMSGQSASFLAGGELPIPVPQGLGTTSIEYKPFGIGLTLTPTVLSNDRIVLKVAPEASDLDYTNALSLNGVAVPAITTRRADTTVELGDGESFIIGGLVSRSTTSNADKVPLLGDLPILGAFFSKNNYKMNEKELVILVTPHLVKPIARGTDLAPYLPGSAEQRDGPVWRSYFLGGAADTAVPGFSRLTMTTEPCIAEQPMNAPRDSIPETGSETYLFASSNGGHITWLTDALGSLGSVVVLAPDTKSIDERIALLGPWRCSSISRPTREIAANQLHQRLKRDWPTLPVLATGVSAEPAAMLSALRAGVDDFIDMAAPSTEAVTTLRALLDRRSTLQGRHARQHARAARRTRRARRDDAGHEPGADAERPARTGPGAAPGPCLAARRGAARPGPAGTRRPALSRHAKRLQLCRRCAQPAPARPDPAAHRARASQQRRGHPAAARQPRAGARDLACGLRHADQAPGRFLRLPDCRPRRLLDHRLHGADRARSAAAPGSCATRASAASCPPPTCSRSCARAASTPSASALVVNKFDSHVGLSAKDIAERLELPLRHVLPSRSANCWRRQAAARCWCAPRATTPTRKP
jgi:pilus assembly protein CpaC